MFSQKRFSGEEKKMNIINILSELSEMYGVSGDEHNAALKTADIIKKETGLDSVFNGNSIIVNIGCREENKKHVLLDAHIDEVGMIVSYIDDDGFIVPSNIGGMDYRILPAQRVVVHGQKEIPGIISTVPPHLTSGENVLKNMDHVRIDTGYSADELKKLVTPGCTVSFDVKFRELQGNCVTGKSLDNRTGAAVLIRLADMIKNDTLSCSVSLLFSAAEEIGERGAKTACFEINPDIAVAVDTSFALTSDEDKKHCGIMGNGPMIGISPSLSREISDMLKEAAEKNNIPYQTEVMNGLTGTNADQFSVSRCGVKTCTCSVPIKYMHTPAETADIRDIENTAALLAGFIRMVK